MPSLSLNPVDQVAGYFHVTGSYEQDLLVDYHITGWRVHAIAIFGETMKGPFSDRHPLQSFRIQRENF